MYMICPAKWSGDIALSDAVFGIEPNSVVMHAAVVNYLANQRQGTQSTLTRTEVRGGGRKPWRQKGTGHARQGSIRAPQWRHGGVALGPKPRDYRYSLNKKVKKLAMLSAPVFQSERRRYDRSGQHQRGRVQDQDDCQHAQSAGRRQKAMIVMPSVDDKLIQSASNIPGVQTALVNTINVYDILNHDKFIIVKSAVEKLEEVYA